LFDFQLRVPGEDNLPEIMSSMTIGAVNGILDPTRGQRMHNEDKRCWPTNGATIAPNSAGSSQSGTPSPPITPPQEEQWDSGNCKQKFSVTEFLPHFIISQKNFYVYQGLQKPRLFFKKKPAGRFFKKLENPEV